MQPYPGEVSRQLRVHSAMNERKCYGIDDAYAQATSSEGPVK